MEHESAERESAASLLSRLVGDCAALVRNEVALAKAELAESSARAKAGMVALIGAVSTLLAGSLAIVAAIVLGLAKVMEPWLAALIVGVAITVVGLLLLQAARKKLLPPHVEIDRTRASVRHDVQVLARRT
jgi:xanthine/uracil permease